MPLPFDYNPHFMTVAMGILLLIIFAFKKIEANKFNLRVILIQKCLWKIVRSKSLNVYSVLNLTFFFNHESCVMWLV